MSNMGDSVENISVDDFLEFISEEGKTFLSYTTFQPGQFVENGFLKTLFDKNPQQPVDKAQLLVDMFGESNQEADDEQKQVRDIIVYDILYTWDVEKILGELTICGKTIKLSLKWQHKY
ncbi:hypothetical protein RhiirA1_475896 [Rhizophagus irregularis]|uniref:Uncharacterized protein n=1 Tax=Rhizophagus irregularis TaxID=588596 RepID=A0A2N0QW45_9GLOM|nr:hypothetical protein RhiirA1_475896 [Rhizophagus irregularis]